MSLKGKVAIVTGASRGIGRAVALALARAQCKVVVAAKSIQSTPGLEGSIYTVADEIEALGAEALPFQLDVRDDAKVEISLLASTPVARLLARKPFYHTCVKQNGVTSSLRVHPSNSTRWLT
eukprot:Colp12_sorted_trinity150504_noHs@36273